MEGYEMYCNKCGAELKQGALYCTKCGAKTGQMPVQQTKNGEHKSSNMSNQSKNKGQKKIIFPIIIVLEVIIIVVFIAAIVFIGLKKSNTINEVIEDETQENIDEEIDKVIDHETEKQTETELEQVEKTPINIKEELKAYAATFSMCNIDGAQYEYELIEDYGYTHYQAQGLTGYTGCLDWTIADIDEDGTEELIAFMLQPISESNQIEVHVYEYTDEGVVFADSNVLLSNVLGAFCDMGGFRVLLKDRKYICSDNAETTFVSADGTFYEFYIYSYDGTKLIQEIEDSVIGSDIGEYGKEPSNTGLIQKLNELGFFHTARSFYDMSELSINTADEGVEILFEVNIENNYSFQEDDKPLAICHFIKKGINID